MSNNSYSNLYSEVLNDIYYSNPFYFIYKSKDLLNKIKEKKEQKDIILFTILTIYVIVYIILFVMAFYYVIKNRNINIFKVNNNTTLHIILLILSILIANPLWLIYYIYLIYTRKKYSYLVEIAKLPVIQTLKKSKSL